MGLGCSGVSKPALVRFFSIRSDNSDVALLVNVKPRISSGLTSPPATSQTTRAAITVVLPVPAPAMTTHGLSGAVTALCCSAEMGIPSRDAMSTSSFRISSVDSVMRPSRAVEVLQSRSPSGPRPGIRPSLGNDRNPCSQSRCTHQT